MNTIDEIWQELFDREITDAERRLMERIAVYTDSDEATFISTAVTVHCLFSVLVLDPESPVRLGAFANRTLRKLRFETERMMDITESAHGNMAWLNERANDVLKAFDTAENFASWQRNNRITIYEKGNTPYYKEYSVSLDIIGIFIAACVASSIAGSVIAVGFLMMAVGGG